MTNSCFGAKLLSSGFIAADVLLLSAHKVHKPSHWQCLCNFTDMIYIYFFAARYFYLHLLNQKQTPTLQWIKDSTSEPLVAKMRMQEKWI